MARHHKSKRSIAALRTNLRSRENETESMRRNYAAGIEDGMYGGRDMYEPSERRMEYRSGEMITEDHRAIANMPQQVVYREYPRERAYLRTNLDDTMSGIDMQQGDDVGMANRHKAKYMY